MPMPKYDLLLLHPPARLDFKHAETAYNCYLGKSGDVAVTDAFDMYPLGFRAIKAYLLKKGVRVKVVNLASRMLSERLNISSFLRSRKSLVYGIDLHWYAHLDGALALIRLIKRIHPDSRIMVGGFTATYFSGELIRLREIDFVVKGFYAPGAMYRVIKILQRHGRSFARIPGLEWKNAVGRVHANPAAYPAGRINDYNVDWKAYIGGLNKKKFLGNPLILFIPSFGCNHSCAWCGGSRYFYSKYFKCRRGVVRRTKKSIFREIESLSASRKPVDIHSVGHWHEDRGLLLPVLKKMKACKVRKVNFEVWDFPSPAKIEEMARYVTPVFVCSVGSTSAAVRRLCGQRPYPIAELNDWIKKAVAVPGVEIQLWFMVGLPGQTRESVKQDVAYCKRLLNAYRGKRVAVAITPMIGLDPGSMIYDDPDRYGYRLFGDSAADMRALMTGPYWKHRLNYRTDRLSRDDIFEISLYAASEIVKEECRIGSIPGSIADGVLARIRSCREFVKKIEAGLKDQGCLSAALKKEILRENRRWEQDNTTVLYPVRTLPETQWFNHAYI
jgi:clorobiocin/coumermycin A biosynthesis protein CloN6/CouN6